MSIGCVSLEKISIMLGCNGMVHCIANISCITSPRKAVLELLYIRRAGGQCAMVSLINNNNNNTLF